MADIHNHKDQGNGDVFEDGGPTSSGLGRAGSMGRAAAGPLSLPRLPRAAPAHAGSSLASKAPVLDTRDSQFDEEEDEDTGELEVLKKAMQKVLESKKTAVAQKQAAILQEHVDNVNAQSKAMEASIAKDAKDMGTATKVKLAKIQKGLAEKVATMETITTKYQQDMHGQWSAYNELYSGLETAIAELKAPLEAKRAEKKRKLQQMAADNQRALEEAEKKTEKMRTHASKLPQFAKLMQALM